MVIHELKTWGIFWNEVNARTKMFEVRKNDRNFKVGDVLVLREWDHKRKRYTGNVAYRFVTLVMDLGSYFNNVVPASDECSAPGYAVLSLEPIDRSTQAKP